MTSKPEKNPAAQELRKLRGSYDKSREQIQKINAAKPPPKACECSAGNTNPNYHDHEKSCPVYKRLCRAEYRRLKKEKEQNNER